MLGGVFAIPNNNNRNNNKAVDVGSKSSRVMPITEFGGLAAGRLNGYNHEDEPESLLKELQGGVKVNLRIQYLRNA